MEKNKLITIVTVACCIFIYLIFFIGMLVLGVERGLIYSVIAMAILLPILCIGGFVFRIVWAIRIARKDKKKMTQRTK